MKIPPKKKSPAPLALLHFGDIMNKKHHQSNIKNKKIKNWSDFEPYFLSVPFWFFSFVSVFYFICNGFEYLINLFIGVMK